MYGAVNRTQQCGESLLDGARFLRFTAQQIKVRTAVCAPPQLWVHRVASIFFLSAHTCVQAPPKFDEPKKHVVDGNAGSSRRILGAQCGQPPPNCDKLVHACAKVGRSVRILLINVIYLEFELIALKSNNVGLYM